MSKSAVYKSVLDFLTQGNRPYAVNDIWEQCRAKESGKAAVQKALDALVNENRVTMKCFGKQKIYLIKQDSNIAEQKKSLQVFTQKLNQSQHSVKSKQAKYRELETQLKFISKVRSLGELEDERSTLLDDIRELNEKLRVHEAQAKEAKFTTEDVKTIESRYELCATAYRKRKRICTNMLDAILEGYPKPKKALMEDIGLETDEEVGFQVQLN